jgi:sugar phosphate isomerase/epimerase
MKFGICAGTDLAAMAKAAGFDYLEGSVGNVLKPREPQAAFEAGLESLRNAALPTPALNCFVPGDLRITGPTADLAALEAYATTAFVRAKQAGVDTIVFGSGGARKVDEGWDHARATDQIIEFLKRIAPAATANGVTVVIEPLQRKECNIVTTVGEGAKIARAVNESSIKLLVDGYHWAADNDAVEGITANGDLLRHAHLATLPNRKAPGVEPFDFGPLFGALRKAKYDRRISIEGGFDKTPEVLSKALAVMREAYAAAR